MPPDVQARAEAVDRGLLVLMHSALLTIVIVLLRSSAISTNDVGLTLRNWESALGLGALFSLIPLGTSAAARRTSTPDQAQDDPSACSPLAIWAGLQLLGSFSHEFWRAFCIVAFIDLDLSAWPAVMITAVSFGLVRIHRSTAQALGAATFGALAGYLFVRTGSLLAPIAMTLIAGIVGQYQIRRGTVKASVDLPPVKCPACPRQIASAEIGNSARVICPECQAHLIIGPPVWVVSVGGLVAGAVFFYEFKTEPFVALLLAAPVSLGFSILSAILVGAFLPRLRSARMEDRFDKKLFRF
jgi:membrane protease YdiL (CAAX protease family)